MEQCRQMQLILYPIFPSGNKFTTRILTLLVKIQNRSSPQRFPMLLFHNHSQLSPTLSPLAAAAAKLLQSCLTLCDLIDGSPPGFSIPGILQARTLEWVDISFSNAWKWKMKVKSLSHVRLFETPWTAAHQVPPSMGFTRQESSVLRTELLSRTYPAAAPANVSAF